MAGIGGSCGLSRAVTIWGRWPPTGIQGRGAVCSQLRAAWLPQEARPRALSVSFWGPRPEDVRRCDRGTEGRPYSSCLGPVLAADEVTQTVSEEDKEGQTRRGREREAGSMRPTVRKEEKEQRNEEQMEVLRREGRLGFRGLQSCESCQVRASPLLGRPALRG